MNLERIETLQTILIDTDVAIDFLKGRKYASELIEPYILANTAYLSILSVYELYAGMRDEEAEKTGDFIFGLMIEPVNRETAVRAGAFYRQYRKQGITLTAIDCLIGACASIQGHKIATRNKSHYPDTSLILDF